MRFVFAWFLSSFGISRSRNPRDLSEKFYNLFMLDRKFLVGISLRMLNEHGITASKHTALYKEYARYMALKATSVNDFEVPSKLVDLVWHEHLQFNFNYEKICKAVFGRVIYHHPAVPGEDVSTYEDVYQETLIRYLSIFGTPPIEIWGALPIEVSEATISKLKTGSPSSGKKKTVKAASTTAKTKDSKSSTDSNDYSSGSDDAGILSSIATCSPVSHPTETHCPSSDSAPASSCGSSSASSCGGGSSSSCGSSSSSSSCGGGSSCGGASCGGGGS